MWLYAQPWLPLITITLAAGPSEQFYKDSRREQAETLRLRGRPRGSHDPRRAGASFTCLLTAATSACGRYVSSRRTPVRRDTQSDETPGVAMHRGFCFSGLKRP